MTTLSNRLAAALVALEEAATDHTDAPGVLALCIAARAWTRVADEADGDPERTALRATIAALQASIATAEREIIDVAQFLDCSRDEVLDVVTSLYNERVGLLDKLRGKESAKGDVARLAAALARAGCIAEMWSATSAAEDILRHLAGPLPGADQAEALIAAYVDAFAETSGTICDRWAEVDQKRKDHAIATMRRAMLAVGATAPARVTVGAVEWTWDEQDGIAKAVMGRLTLRAAPSWWTVWMTDGGSLSVGRNLVNLDASKAAAVAFALSLNGATITGGGK